MQFGAVQFGVAEAPRGWRFACFLTAPAPEAHCVHRWGSGLGRRRALIVYVFVRHALAARLSQLRAAAAQRTAADAARKDAVVERLPRALWAGVPGAAASSESLPAGPSLDVLCRTEEDDRWFEKFNSSHLPLL